MLKNVAIPLMLAASQAEAQDAKMSKEMREAVEDSLRADLGKGFRGLQADAAACTVAASEDADGIANLAQAQSEKEQALKDAELAVTNLIADDGAWGAADAKRKAAVEAAVAKEAAEDIAGLLDAVDTAAEAERAAAKEFVAKDRLYQDGVRLAALENQRNTDAQAMLGELLQAKQNADASVQTAMEQLTKETNWRSWRYCELGATVVDATVPNSSRGWWQMIQEEASYTAARPATCIVPAVMSDATPPVEVRPAITYYATIGADPGLPAEVDGVSLWQAQVVLERDIAADAAVAYQGQDRTAAGKVAWLTQSLKLMSWLKASREREKAWLLHIQKARGDAKDVAAEMSAGASFVTDADIANVTAAQKSVGLGAAATGARKALLAQVLLRDANTVANPGSGYAMAAGRTQVSTAGEEWKTTWALTGASMDAWTAANGSTAGPLHVWWGVARTLTAAVQAWHDAYAASTAEITAATMTAGANVGNTSCDLTTGTWTANADGQAGKAACLTACASATVNALVYNPDTTQGSGGATTTANNGGATMAVLTPHAGAWCGAYSFDSAEGTAAQKCQLLLGAAGPPSQHGTQPGSAVAANACAKMSATADFASKQADVSTAWAAVTAQMYTDMSAAAGVQAGLEKDWLQAWYLQQYWAAIVVELTEATSGSLAERNKGAIDTNGGNAAQGRDSLLGATADESSTDSSLEVAQRELAALQATTAASQATVTALGARILRADAQLVELGALVKTAPAKGTLDEAADVRDTEWKAYGNDGSAVGSTKGEATLASEAKAAADLAVKARVNNVVANEAVHTDAATGDGGALLEARLTALANWNNAVAATGVKREDLTAALDTASLSALRETVAEDTAAWDEQQGVLVGLVGDVADAEDALAEAEKAKDKAILNCQIAAYDKYRTTLEGEMVQRIADLKTIQGLIEAAIAARPAPGTAGARCEKALSNGTKRPQRGEQTCDEGLCCGAARVWMSAGDGVADAAWRTIETCQDSTASNYDYQPARAPMATTAPSTVSVPFTCIEGAKKLAAAASAVAAAVYMLA